MRRPLALLACLVLGAVGIGSVGGANPALPVAPPPRTPPVAELIRRLGSEDFGEREAATDRLSALPFAVPPPDLIAALASPQPEVSRLAGQAVRTMRERAEARALGRERAFAKRGAVDRFVASTATWDIPANDDRPWQAALDVATTLVARSKIQWTPAKGRGSITPRAFWVTCHNHLSVRSDELYSITDQNKFGEVVLYWPGGIQATEVVAPHVCMRNIIVARGPVRAGNYIGESVILANGNVRTARFLSTSIVVSDGDVEVAENVSDCVVVARGNIKLGGYVSGSAVIAGGKVMVGKTLKPPLRERLVIEENVRRPLGFVSFFELDQVGVEVATADGGVRVMGLMAGKPLAAAGVQKGDLVTKVGGSAVGSPEELRRQLRDASGTRGEARLTIRRGGETVELRVVIPD